MTLSSKNAVRGHGRRRGLLMQVVTTLALAMNHLVMGVSVAFAGVFTEQITSADAGLQLSVSQISWICSITSVGNMLGYLISSYVNPMYGAIRVCQICAPLVAGGYLMVALGNNFWVLLAGRLLLGLFNGVTTGPTNTHVGEIASANLRGFLTSSMITIGVSGITCTYLTGWLLGWRQMCLVMGISPMVFMFVITLMLPRSPRWLIVKGHPAEEAARSLKFYFGDDFNVDSELKGIRESLGDGHKHDATLVQVLGRLRHRHNLVPFLLVLALYVFFVFSGGFTTTTFAPVIFKDVGGFSNPYMGSILVGVVRVVATIMCSVVMNRLHRRTLLMVNGAVGGAGCLVAGCYFFYREQLSDHAWLSLTSVLVIVFFMSLGISPLKSVLFGELLPNSIRSELGGICLAFFGTSNFLMVYTFPLVLQTVGMSGIYWFFTLMHFLMLAFSLFCLPDTNGKSIEEIQKMFLKNAASSASKHRPVCVVEEPKERLTDVKVHFEGPKAE
ncbi:facilitated trehalose transporter Tret1-like [Amphibalanus amphitrite]|nr:facilitated trehalose transporter Tret1-like [Amphibalanus amphitrite]